MPSAWPGKDSDGNILLIVSGPTQHAPFLKSWKCFKDDLRTIVQDQPGWVEVIPSQKLGREDAQGWARLRRQGDAEAAYQTYHRLTGTLVHIWETRRIGEDFRLRKCNCSFHFPDVLQGAHSPRCGIDFTKIGELNSQASAMPISPYSSSPRMLVYSTYSQSRMYNGMPMGVVQASHPAHAANLGGIPTSIGNRAVLTEVRGICIRNLHQQISPEQLASLLTTIGYPLDCKLLRDSRTGVFRGTATAEFSSGSEACNAVNRLNGKKHLGMRLDVRLGMDSTGSGSIEPVIANGSEVGINYRM